MVEMKKRNRKRRSDEAGMSIDRISDLPDSILCLILSFMPTIYSVQTSVLSKRWKCLWTKVPALYFGDIEHNNWTRPYCSRSHPRAIWPWNFEQFVDWVLSLHDAPSLNKFILYWDNCDYELFHLDTWVTTAIARNIRHLDLEFKGMQGLELPGSFYTCKTLELVELRKDVIIEAPSLVHLPRLETLILVSVCVDGESFCKLVDGCPVLRSLTVERTPIVDGITNFTVSSSSLKHLSLRVIREPVTWCSDDHLILEINAPSLEYLYIWDDQWQDFILKSLTSLLKVEIDVSFIEYSVNNTQESDYCNSVVKLVQGLSHAKCIDLQGDTLHYFGNATAHLSAEFHTLSKLILAVERCGWNSLQDLLECSVNLEVLILKKVRIHGDTDYLSWRNPARVPSCLLSSLQEISIICFDAIEYDLAMLRYFLKHGEVLKKIELYVAETLDIRLKFEMLKKISVFCRKSSTCEIHFLERNS